MNSFRTGFDNGPGVGKGYRNGDPPIVEIPFNDAADVASGGNAPYEGIINGVPADLRTTGRRSTLLGFSLGWMVWGALVAFINALVWLYVIAVLLYGSLAIFGALLFAGIGVRHLIAHHRRTATRGETRCAAPDIIPPIVVADHPDCRFYRSSAAALAGGVTPRMKLFDAQGRRLEPVAVGLRVSATAADGAEELAAVLRQWLGYQDAIRWSVADWELPLLMHASVEHLGYSD